MFISSRLAFAGVSRPIWRLAGEAALNRVRDVARPRHLFARPAPPGETTARARACAATANGMAAHRGACIRHKIVADQRRERMDGRNPVWKLRPGFVRHVSVRKSRAARPWLKYDSEG